MVAYAWFIPLFIVRLFYLPIASFHLNLPCHVCLLLQRQDFPLPSLSRVQAIAVAYISFNFFLYSINNSRKMAAPRSAEHVQIDFRFWWSSPSSPPSMFFESRFEEGINKILRVLWCRSAQDSVFFMYFLPDEILYRLLYGLPLFSGALRRLPFLSQDYDLANFAMRGLPISIIK